VGVSAYRCGLQVFLILFLFLELFLELDRRN
jgi:hypothetical protein